MKSKKGSHVGVVLSFVIFVTFLVFLFSIFDSPFKTPEDNDPLIDYLEIELAQKFNSNLTILTISPPGIDPCIEIDNSRLGLEGLNAIVKNKSGGIIPSKISGDDLLFKWSGEEFFKIYYSEKLSIIENEVGTGCYQLDFETDINSFRENYYFDKPKILEFFSKYKSDYSELKSELGVPINNEFGLTFIDANGQINQTEQKDITTNIYSKEIPIQYFDELANINSGFINIKVW